MPLVIGVAGSIATGKSHLASYLVDRYDAVHLDVDQVVHRRYDPGTPSFDRVVEAFGPSVVAPDDHIDRRALGQLIFGSPERTLALKDALGDWTVEVQAIVDEWRAELPHDRIAVLEAFNLVEMKFGAWCDVSWIVRTEPDIALRRILARNNLTEDEAHTRLAAARSWELRIHAIDRALDNNGTVEDFERTIDDALGETLEAYRAGTLPVSKGHQAASETGIPRGSSL